MGPTFECGKVCLCHSELPALDPQPQPVLGMRHSSRDGWGQAVHVRHLHRAAIKNNNIAVFMGINVTLRLCAVRCEDQGRRPGYRRRDYPEQKNGCSFEKKGSASAHINSSHSCDIVANVNYVVALPKGKIYLQLVKK